MKAFISSLAIALSITTSVKSAPGSVDAAFDPNIDGEVNALALQPDGKILAGGVFTSVGGVSRPGLARLNTNGSLDAGYNPRVEGGHVRGVALYANGDSLLVGNFATVSGLPRVRLARVNTNGVPDPAFIAVTDDDTRLSLLLNDGKILVGGVFGTLNGVARNALGRVNADGSLDLSYNPSPNGQIRCFLYQPDGKIVIAGSFSTIAGSTRARIARFNMDGTLDSGFNPAVTGSAIYCMALQPDGKIILGGVFTAVGGVARANVARVNASGALDPGFVSSADDTVRSVALQTDGRMIFSGNFSNMGGSTRRRIARLNASGILDPDFNPVADDAVFGVALQADGKILAAGFFDTIGGVARNRIARLDNDPATQSLTTSGTNRVQWLRGGSSPETYQVTFEWATDAGGTWVLLGNGTRIPGGGGWELTGLNLPGTGVVRARGRTHGGYGNGSQGMVETMAPIALSPLQTWRFTHFGVTESTGPGANNADPDKDGLENLVEYAFGLNPNVSGTAGFPAWQRDDDNYILTFTRPANATDITYVAEYSENLGPGSWTPVANTGAGNNVAFVRTALGSRCYLRLRVTSP